jgi:hypothetical protein
LKCFLYFTPYERNIDYSRLSIYNAAFIETVFRRVRAFFKTNGWDGIPPDGPLCREFMDLITPGSTVMGISAASRFRQVKDINMLGDKDAAANIAVKNLE